MGIPSSSSSSSGSGGVAVAIAVIIVTLLVAVVVVVVYRRRQGLPLNPLAKQYGNPARFRAKTFRPRPLPDESSGSEHAYVVDTFANPLFTPQPVVNGVVPNVMRPKRAPPTSPESNHASLATPAVADKGSSPTIRPPPQPTRPVPLPRNVADNSATHADDDSVTKPRPGHPAPAPKPGSQTSVQNTNHNTDGTPS